MTINSTLYALHCSLYILVFITPIHAQWFHDTFGTGTFNTAAANPLISGATATGITHNGVASSGVAWYHANNPVGSPEVSYGENSTATGFTLTESFTVKSNTTGNVTITSISVDVRCNTAGSNTFASCKINGTSYAVSSSAVTTSWTTTTITVSPALTFPANSNISVAMAFTGATGANNTRIDNFKLFGTNGLAVVLPIELTQFDVQNTEGSKNHLTWRTASEKDNSHFDIERSTDGNNFYNIGQVKGNNKPSSYQFVDNQPFATSYYRLRQIDFDGTETVSKIVSAELKGKSKGLKIYPTIVSNGILTVNTEGEQLDDFSVTNLLGQQVLVGKTTTQIDVSSLSKGTYVLKVGTEVAKFVKQ